MSFIPIFIPIAGGSLDRYWKLTLILTIALFGASMVAIGAGGFCPAYNVNMTGYDLCTESTGLFALTLPFIFGSAIMTFILWRMNI